MKRTGKTLLIIAICCILFGATLGAIAGAVIYSRGESWEYNGEVYDALGQYRELDSITALELTLVNEPVIILRGGDKVTIEWSQRYDDQYSIYAAEGGTLSLSRVSNNTLHWGRGWFNIDLSWLADWYNHGQWNTNIEDASNRPVTVTIPEGMELSRVQINGADISAELYDGTYGSVEVNGANAIVLLDGINARNVSVNGANAELTMICDDPSEWNFEITGLSATLRVDGRSQGGIGHSEYTRSGATRWVSVNGVNAMLDVLTK